jgi:hypothetical protein
MRNNLLVAAVLACMLCLLVASPTQAFPPLPCSFYGSITGNGSNVPDGTLVRAFIDGHAYAETHTLTYQSKSVYSLDIPGDDSETDGIQGGQPGSVIHFEVGGVMAEATSTWRSGTNTKLDLVITGATLATPAPQPTQTSIQAPPAAQPTVVTVAPPTQPPSTAASSAPTAIPQIIPTTTADQQPVDTTIATLPPANTQAPDATAQAPAALVQPTATPIAALEQPATPAAPAPVNATASPVEVSRASEQQMTESPAKPAVTAQPVVTTVPTAKDGTNTANDFWVKAGIALMVATVAGVSWLIVRRR